MDLMTVHEGPSTAVLARKSVGGEGTWGDGREIPETMELHYHHHQQQIFKK